MPTPKELAERRWFYRLFMQEHGIARENRGYGTNWGTTSKRTRRRDGACQECGATDSLHAHHIQPLSRGGTNKADNLVTLCSECHKATHSRMRNDTP